MHVTGAGARARRAVLAVALAGSAAVLGLAAPSAAAAPAPARYLVVTDPGVRPAALDVRAERTYRSAVTGFSATLTAEQARVLRADRRVHAVYRDRQVQGAAQRTTPAVQRVDAAAAPVRAGDGTGNVSGVAVAVLDTGVDTHQDLNVVGGYDCISGTTYADGNGHGTGVAGAIAAVDNGVGIVGTAPGAPIYSVRVLDGKLKGTADTLTCGLDWVKANAARYGIKVVNLSLGTPGSDDGDCGRRNGDVLHMAICSLTASGVVVVSSAGNTKADLARVVPGAYDEVLAVTNVADFDGRPGGTGAPPCSTPERDDVAASTSSFAVSAADAAHTVAGPGVCPFTTKKGNRYGYIQPGTSMAAAYAAGVVLDCLRPGYPCAGKPPAETIQTVIAYARRETLQRAHGFVGDPQRPSAGKHYGYLVSAAFTGSADPGDPPPPPPPGDTTPPTTSVTRPAAGATLSGSVVFEATAADDTGVTRLAFFAGGTMLGNATRGTGGTWSLTYDTRSAPDGRYAVTAQAWDAAGNTGVSGAVSVTVANTGGGGGAGDTTAPTARVVAPATGATVSGPTTLVAEASDDRGVTAVGFYSGSTTLCSAALVNGRWSCTYDTRGAPNGTYAVVAKARDAAGNTGTSPSVSLTIRN